MSGAIDRLADDAEEAGFEFVAMRRVGAAEVWAFVDSPWRPRPIALPTPQPLRKKSIPQFPISTLACVTRFAHTERHEQGECAKGKIAGTSDDIRPSFPAFG